MKYGVKVKSGLQMQRAAPSLQNGVLSLPFNSAGVVSLDGEVELIVAGRQQTAEPGAHQEMGMSAAIRDTRD